MSMQKLPILGYFAAGYLNVPGQTGTGALSPFTVVTPAANKVAISRFRLSVTASNIVVASGRCTVTLTSHLNTILGQQVTFSSLTGTSALLNDQTWTIDTITSSSVYSFPCNVPDCTGATSGTVYQEPVFTLPQGFNIVSMDANANVEMCIDNTYMSPTGYSVSGVATAMPTTAAGGWIIMVTGNATPVRSVIPSDGFAARIRCMGTTATSYFSNVA